MNGLRLAGKVLLLTLAASCNRIDPAIISDISDSAVTVQQMPYTPLDAVTAEARRGCGQYGKDAVPISYQCVDQSCGTKRHLYACSGPQIVREAFPPGVTAELPPDASGDEAGTTITTPDEADDVAYSAGFGPDGEPLRNSDEEDNRYTTTEPTFETGERETIEVQQGRETYAAVAPFGRASPVGPPGVSSAEFPPFLEELTASPTDATGVFRRVERAIWIVVAAPDGAQGVDLDRAALGSAVAISDQLLLTNCHTLEDRPNIAIVRKDDDRSIHSVRLFRSRESVDQCVLETEVPVLRPVEGARALIDLTIGEKVYSIGAPREYDLTLGEGIVSGKRSKGGTRHVQTTALIAPGSSGGGLFDARGNLIGITTLYDTEGTGINFAITVDEFWQ